MIVITGAPRTGTSMMMQTLKILGVPIVGEKFSDYNIEDGNKKGYYELNPEDISKGVKTNQYQGKAIKLFGDGLRNTNCDLIDKLIVCKRDREASVNSFQKLMEISPLLPIEPSKENAAKVVRYNATIADLYLKVHEGPVLTVWFHEMIDNPKDTIKKIIDYLNIKSSKYRINRAINNIERA